ncbi:hypothetical protein Bca52824_003342 [Brassica carinata]|uniref:Large ribosomal subunit protein uL2 C-terminal domain-containing protein n=1 Tax=Brassica carinata TaxID=52824 RepID=A0A8X7WMI4_BRACI|nr:hypothetical protein Bca52824_003342 [Brassica carinata]
MITVGPEDLNRIFSSSLFSAIRAASSSLSDYNLEASFFDFALSQIGAREREIYRPMSALVALCRARAAASSSSSSFLNSVVRPAFRSLSTGFGDAQNKTLVAEMEEKMLHMDINSMIGSSMPLGGSTPDAATIGTVSNPPHGVKKLYKAGQSRWLGIRPKVRGGDESQDHPHGGGEGKSKSSGSRGRTSVSPWGNRAKEPKGRGYKSASVKMMKKRLAAREAKI